MAAAGRWLAGAAAAGRPLVERLAAEAERQWRGLSSAADGTAGLVSLVYSNRKYASRRAPDEIESVLSSLDKAAIDLLQRSFDGRALGLWDFLQAVVQTGTYKPDRLLPFVAGAVDLFMEVLWSTTARNPQPTDAVEIRWGDLMNHLLERPEMVYWGGAIQSKPMQMYCSSFIDGAKHAGPNSIEGLCWIRQADITATIESGPFICLRCPPSKVRELTPDLTSLSGMPSDAEFKVLAIAWDDKQDLVALLSNRMVVQWRMRSMEGSSHFQQMRLFLARPASLSGGSSPSSEQGQEKKASVNLHLLNRRSGMNEESWFQELQTDRRAMADATQVAIWWSSQAQRWVTSNHQGRLSFWDFRRLDHVIDGADILVLAPTHELTVHSDVVTGYTELDPEHFATCSSDQTIVVWDSRFYVHETVLRGHTSRVLSQAYLPCISGLISVGREWLVHVWYVAKSGTGALRTKLKGHQANLLRVTASERVFFTLDEAANVFLWDATSLSCVQTLSCSNWEPEHMFCMPSHGRICVVGRRLHYIEANEPLAAALGAVPSEEEQAQKQRLQDTVKLRRSGAPRWCGLSANRGCFLSATEYEVRFHPRSRPAQPRVVFSAPEGDAITAFSASGRLSTAVCCTARGNIYMLKYRSGYVAAVHKSKPADPEEAFAKATGSGVGSFPEAENAEAARRRSTFGSSTAHTLEAEIRCVTICEKLACVYVGLSDGQVSVIACQPGYPVVRQLTHSRDTSAVTCLHCSEETGLLAVGTFGCWVHFYVIEHLRLAGSMNLNLLRRKGSGQGAPLRSLHLFNVAAKPDLPLTLLTVNEHSRVQLWGVQVRSNEGKLALVHSVADLRRLQAVHPLRGSKEARGRQGENGVWLSGHKLVELLGEKEEQPLFPKHVELTAMVVVIGAMALPGHRSEDAEDDAGAEGAGDHKLGAFGEGADTVGERLPARPRTPRAGRCQTVEVDGGRYAFLADESGWIWCIDIPGTISVCSGQQDSVELPLNPSRKQQLYRRYALKRMPSTHATIKQLHSMGNLGLLNPTTMSSLPDVDSSEDERAPIVLQTAAAWLAHASGVATLTATGSYPALVSTGRDKDVKVWSTHGDLWGHFPMLSTDSEAVPAVWPPPQVLAAQVALMSIAEEFCGGGGRCHSLFHPAKSNGRRGRRNSAINRSQSFGGATETDTATSRISMLDSPKSRGRGAWSSGAAGSKSPALETPVLASRSPAISFQELSSTKSSTISERRAARSRSMLASETVAPADKSDGAEVASPASQSTACPSRDQASVASPKSETETMEASSPMQTGDEASIFEESPLPSPASTSTSPGRTRRSGFTSEQMEQMVQNHAFSSGCQSFKEFVSHTEARMSARNQTQGSHERALRSDFWDRPTSGLGIEVGRRSSKEGQRKKGMGRKAASESALLRYVQGSVAEMTRTVREDMGVDVQALTREQIMRSSFIGRLDLGGVSHDPNDAKSVTSQIAKQLSRPTRDKRKLPSIFAATGQESVSGHGRHGAHTSPLRGRADALAQRPEAASGATL